MCCRDETHACDGEGVQKGWHRDGSVGMSVRDCQRIPFSAGGKVPLGRGPLNCSFSDS